MVKRWFYGQRRNCLKKEVWCGYQSSEAIKGCSKISCLWDQVAKNTSDHLIFFLCFKSVLRVCFSCWRFHGWPWQNTTSLKTKNPPKNVLIGVSQQEVTIRIHKIIIDPPKNSPFVNFFSPTNKITSPRTVVGKSSGHCTWPAATWGLVILYTPEV